MARKKRNHRKVAKLNPRRRKVARGARGFLRREFRYAVRGLTIGAIGAFLFLGNDFRKAAFPVGEFEGRVSYVVDGDTLHLHGVEPPIRLWGVDAPEIGSPGGAAATKELKKNRLWPPLVLRANHDRSVPAHCRALL